VDVLTSNFAEHGGRIIHGKARHFRIDTNKVRGVVIDGETVKASAVVLAAGAWSNQLSRVLGDNHTKPGLTDATFDDRVSEQWYQPRIPRTDSAPAVQHAVDGRLADAGCLGDVRHAGLAAQCGGHRYNGFAKG
jgi:glycine/D-amino acid oxidase-like deaminating enzyme